MVCLPEPPLYCIIVLVCANYRGAFVCIKTSSFNLGEEREVRRHKSVDALSMVACVKVNF